jgi:hypothetical protein
VCSPAVPGSFVRKSHYNKEMIIISSLEITFILEDAVARNGILKLRNNNKIQKQIKFGVPTSSQTKIMSEGKIRTTLSIKNY